MMRAVRARLQSTVFLARAAVVISSLALLIAVTGVTPVNAVSVVKRALSAKNADRVDGISASRKPRARQLVPLASNRKFPRSVIPRTGVRGPRGPIGPTGPGGAAGRNGASSVYLANGAGLRLSTAANVETDAARLDNLPAGNWLLIWSATVDWTGSPTGAWCKLRVGAAEVAGADTAVGSANNAAVITASAATSQEAPFSVILRCFQTSNVSAPSVGVDSQHIIAIKADALTVSP